MKRFQGRKVCQDCGRCVDNYAPVRKWLGFENVCTLMDIDEVLFRDNGPIVALQEVTETTIAPMTAKCGDMILDRLRSWHGKRLIQLGKMLEVPVYCVVYHQNCEVFSVRGLSLDAEDFGSWRTYSGAEYAERMRRLIEE